MSIVRDVAGLIEIDQFTRPDAATPGGNWVVDLGTAAIVSNRLDIFSTGASRPGVRHTGTARTENFSQVVYRYENSGFPCALAHARASGNPRDGYGVGFASATSCALVTLTGTAPTIIQSDLLGSSPLTDYQAQLYTTDSLQQAFTTGNGDTSTLFGTDINYNGVSKTPTLYRAAPTNSSNSAIFDDHIWMKSKYVVVDGLSAGYKAKIINGVGSVVATATESGGTATIDASRFGSATEFVPVAGWPKLRITDGSDVTIEEYTATTVYPGDEYTYANLELQKVTQIVLLVGTNRYADGDPPPEEDHCTGGGTVASGSNPTDGTSLATATALHAVFRITVNSVQYDFAQTAINHGSPAKTPRVDTFGTLRRALPDERGGIELPTVSIDLFDHDNLLRGWHDNHTLHGLTGQVLVADEATWRAGGANAQVRFSGVVSDFEPMPGPRYRLTLEDPLTSALEIELPRALIDINDGTSDQGLRATPYPALYGSLVEDGGAIEIPFIGTQTPVGHSELGNRHRHLFCRGAIHNIRAIFRADPLSGDPPTQRSAALASEYESDFLAPHISPNWYESELYSVLGGFRITLLDLEQTHPAANLARYGRIPLTANVCGRETVGDGTGSTITSAPRQAVHVLNTEWAQTVGDADWPSQAARNGFSIIDVASWEAVKTVSEGRISGGYIGAFVFGHSYEQVTLRWFLEQCITSWDIEPFINRFGQLAATMLDRTDTAASVPHDTAVLHIQEGSFSINPSAFAVENVTRYVYRRKYVQALQQLNPEEGARLPADAFQADWLSGLQEVTNSTSITALGGDPLGRRENQTVLEMELTRDEATAVNVAQQRNDLRAPKNGRAEATYTVQLQRADDAELGDLRMVTHPEGLGSSGWVAQRTQIRAIEEDWNEMTVTLTVRDVDDLLDVVEVNGLVNSGDPIVLNGDPIVMS